jgi:hypothetical protein
MSQANDRRTGWSRRHALIALWAGVLIALWAGVLPAAMGPAIADDGGAGAAFTWYKGNTHAHSFWSDGDDFPEMAALCYREMGYHFLALSDHNVLAQGEKWIDVSGKKVRFPIAVLEAYRRRFGPEWIRTRRQGDKVQVRLRTLEEVRSKVEQPGRFLMIAAEEISTEFQKTQIHVNAINLAQVIKPRTGKSEPEQLRANLLAVNEQAAALKRPIVSHINHPNWPRPGTIPAEDIAEAVETRFLEFCNASPTTHHYGNSDGPGCERTWDIANTLRLARLRTHPLYGVASDDTHNYHRFGPQEANPGHGWIMVRAKELTAEAILAAMERGDFYCSTGVVLRDVRYDRRKGELTVEVREEPRVNYRIDFVAAPADCDLTSREVRLTDKGGKPMRTTRAYSPEIGKVFLSVPGPRATCKLTGKELFVRAVVRSDRPMDNPIKDEMQTQEAWTQPVGWER